jgi:hypothetical protein
MLHRNRLKWFLVHQLNERVAEHIASLPYTPIHFPGWLQYHFLGS